MKFRKVNTNTLHVFKVCSLHSPSSRKSPQNFSSFPSFRGMGSLYRHAVQRSFSNFILILNFLPHSYSLTALLAELIPGSRKKFPSTPICTAMLVLDADKTGCNFGFSQTLRRRVTITVKLFLYLGPSYSGFKMSNRNLKMRSIMIMTS